MTLSSISTGMDWVTLISLLSSFHTHRTSLNSVTFLLKGKVSVFPVMEHTWRICGAIASLWELTTMTTWWTFSFLGPLKTQCALSCPTSPEMLLIYLFGHFLVLPPQLKSAYEAKSSLCVGWHSSTTNIRKKNQTWENLKNEWKLPVKSEKIKGKAELSPETRRFPPYLVARCCNLRWRPAQGVPGCYLRRLTQAVPRSYCSCFDPS